MAIILLTANRKTSLEALENEERRKLLTKMSYPRAAKSIVLPKPIYRPTAAGGMGDGAEASVFSL